MNEPTIQERIARVRELNNKATPAPWSFLKEGISEGNIEPSVCYFGAESHFSADAGDAPDENDIALILEYRTLAPALADACEALQAKLDEFVLSACRERESLRAQVAELTKDRELLDWLGKHGDYAQVEQDCGDHEDGLEWTIGAGSEGSVIVDIHGKGTTIRAAIDAAMAASGHLAVRTETQAKAAVGPASTEWRTLKVGEKILKGDEFFSANNEWLATISAGMQVCRNSREYRRRIDAGQAEPKTEPSEAQQSTLKRPQN